MATFYVDNTNESGPGSLREAILDANAASGADEIRFNVLTGTILVDGDDLDISDDLRIIGPVDASGRPTITIDGEADSRIFDIGSSAPVTLENLVITNGESTDDGGAIDSASDLTLINTVVSNSLTSTSNEEGGGIYVDGNLRLLDSWIVGNRTTGFQNSEGGGVFVDGNLYAANSTISGNFTDSRDSEGGGIYASGDVIGTNLTIHGNETRNSLGGPSDGGGIYAGGDVFLAFSTVTANSTNDNQSDGGGIATDGLVFITGSIIVGNSTDDDGGGIFASGDVDITNSIVLGNNAVDSDDNVGGASVSITDSITDGSTAGDIFAGTVPTSFGPATDGGALADNGGPVPTVALNPAPGNVALDVVPPMAGTLASLSGLLSGTDETILGIDINRDGDLDDNVVMDDDAPMQPLTDARGAARLVDLPGAGGAAPTAFDYGAVELQSLAPAVALNLVVTTAVDEFDGFVDSTISVLEMGNGLSLREAVALANQNPATADTITFDDGTLLADLTGAEIDLLLGQLSITGPVTIDGADRGITVDAQDMSRVFGIGPDADTTLIGLTIENGETTADGAGNSGGGIGAQSDLTLINSTVRNSGTTGDDAQGGGIFSTGTVNLFNSTVSGNSTTGNDADGGGIRAQTVNAVNATIHGNFTTDGGLAQADGGGIDASTVNLQSSTVTANAVFGLAADGGGISAGTINSANSIITGNVSLLTSEDDTTSPPTLLGNNIVAGELFLGGASQGAGFATDDIFAETDGLGTPVLADNGGPVETVALLLDDENPAVDRGDIGALPADSQDLDGDADTGEVLPVDARGLVRAVDISTLPLAGMTGGPSPLDLGAFEIQRDFIGETSFIVTTNADELDSTQVDATLADMGPDLSLREAVFLANQNGDTKDTITFDLTQMASPFIRLDGGLGTIEITGDVLIDGDVDDDMAPDITISGDTGADDTDADGAMGEIITDLDMSAGALSDNVRIFNITGDNANGGTMIDGLTFTGGFVDDGGIGGAIAANVDLMVMNSRFDGNSTDGIETLGVDIGGGGGAIGVFNDFLGLGGAKRTLTLENTVVTNNTTRGDAAAGGGIFNNGNIIVTGGEISNNTTAGVFSAGGGIGSFGDITLTNTTVSGNQTQSDNSDGGGVAGFSIDAGGSAITVTDSTITGNSTAGETSEGGGIFSNGTVEVTGSTISGNSTVGEGSEGGGIFSSGPLEVTDSTISDNFTTADDADGGGVSVDEEVTITNSLIANNSTLGDGSEGGGIDGDVITVMNSTISGNSTAGEDAEGGGIEADDGNVSIIGSVVSGNSTTGNDAEGGGISINGGVLVLRSRITGNWTEGDGSDGGGVDTDDLLVINSTLDANFTTGSGSDGAGAYASDDARIVNSTIANNTALAGDADGGGLFVDEDLALENATITGNFAGGNGGGAAVRDDFTMINSIVSGNAAGNGGDDVDVGTSESFSGGNILGTDLGLAGATPSGGAVDLTDVFLQTAPLILDVDNDGTTDVDLPGVTAGVLADNGGPTPTVMLRGLDTNPALDVGTGKVPDEDAPSVGNTFAFPSSTDADGDMVLDQPIDTDQRLLGDGTRDVDLPGVGSTPDLGAVEVQRLVDEDLTLVVDTPQDQLTTAQSDATEVDMRAGDGLLSLREALKLANFNEGTTTIVFDGNVFDGSAGTEIILNGADGDGDLFGTLEIFQPVTIDASQAAVSPTLGGSAAVPAAVVVSGDVNMDDAVVPGTMLTDVDATLALDGEADGIDNDGDGETDEAGETLLDDNIQILRITDATAATEITGLTLTGGRTDADNDGGAAILSQAELTLANTSFKGNSTAGWNSNGGAVSVSGGDLSIATSTFDGNAAPGLGANGGGVSVYRGDLTVTDSLFQNNTANFSGAIYAAGYRGVPFYTAVRIENTAITNNSSSNGSGVVGVYDGDVTVLSSTVSDNAAFGGGFSAGAGIAQLGYGASLIVNSTISGNSNASDTTASGGGIYGYGNITLVNSTVTGNSAATDGGMAYGGGVSSRDGGVTLANSIVLGNTAGGGSYAEIYAAAWIKHLGKNIVGADSTAFDTNLFATIANAAPEDVFAITAETLEDTDDDGVPEAPTGILGGELSDNGGPEVGMPGMTAVRQSVDLLREIDNPAIDAGDDTIVDGTAPAGDYDGDGLVDASDTLMFDTRGMPNLRLFDEPSVMNNGANVVDLGAVEIDEIEVPPVAVDDMFGVSEDGPPVTFTLTANDFDLNGDDVEITSVSQPAAGTVTLNPDNDSVTYDPGPTFQQLGAGQVASQVFFYQVNDGTGRTDSARVTVMITGANDAPSADDEAAVVLEDGPAIDIDVLTGDGDIDFGDVLSVASVSPDADGDGVSGAVSVNPDGTISYDPNDQYESLAAGESATDQFTYLVTDSNGGTDVATVTVTIIGQDEAGDDGDDDDDDGPNLAPTANNDAFTVSVLQGPFDANVIANDTDPENDALEIIAATLGGQPGALEIAGDIGIVTYTATPSDFEGLFAGQQTTVTAAYTVSDGKGNTDVATVEITVLGAGGPEESGPPVARDDSFTATGAPITGDLFADNGIGPDFDPDQEPFQVSAVNGQAGAVGNTLALPSGAEVLVGAGGSFTYTPGEDDPLGPDAFNYTITGPDGADTATVRILAEDLTDRLILGTEGDDVLALENFDAPTTIEAMGGDDVINLPLAFDDALIVPLQGGGFRVAPVDAQGLATGQPAEIFGGETFIFDPDPDIDGDETTLILDTSAEARSVTLIYEVFLNRLGDAPGVGFWGGFLAQELLSLDEIAGFFADSPEFAESFGDDLSNKEFVEQLYINGFERIADTEGCEFWAGLIDLHDETGGEAGLDRGTVGRLFAESDEIETIFGNFIDQGILVVA